MSASEAESSSSLASQAAPAEPEAPQRPWVALVSKPRILADAKDERARAMTPRTSIGLELDDPPKPSYLVLHPRIVALDLAAGEFAYQPSACVLAADRSGRLLFRVTKPNPDPGINEPAADEIMYLCNTHSRKTARLREVPYSRLRIEAQPRRSVGLIADTRPGRRGNYLVVQLCPRPPDSAIRLADTLLYYDAAERDWFVKQLHTTTEVRDRNLRGEAGVLAHAGRLYWLALGYGIFFCDPFAKPSHLRFVKLPDGCFILEEPTQVNRMYVALRRRVAPSEGRLRFVDVQGLSYDPDVEPAPVTSPSVKMWTLVEQEGKEPWWRFEYEVRFADVWAHESYATTYGLRHGEVPHVALVDPDDHRVLYFLNTQGNKLFGLDERTKRVVSCEDCPVSGDREIMLQNSRPVIDAWEQSAPPPPSPGRPRASYLELLAATIAQETQRLAGQSYFF